MAAGQATTQAECANASSTGPSGKRQHQRKAGRTSRVNGAPGPEQASRRSPVVRGPGCAQVEAASPRDEPWDAQGPCVAVKGMIAGPMCVTRQEMPGRGEDTGIKEQGTTKGSCRMFRHRGWARGARPVSTGARASCCTDGSGHSKGTAARAASPPSERAVAGGDQIHQPPEGDRPRGGVACGLTGDVEHLVSVACRGSGKGQRDRQTLRQQVVNAACEIPAGRSGRFAHQDMRACLITRLAAGRARPLITKQGTGRARPPTPCERPDGDHSQSARSKSCIAPES